MSSISKERRSHTFGVRLDDATITKLQRLADETDRTRGSVIRLLIQQAEVGSFREVCLLPADQPDAALAEQRNQTQVQEAATRWP